MVTKLYKPEEEEAKENPKKLHKSPRTVEIEKETIERLGIDSNSLNSEPNSLLMLFFAAMPDWCRTKLDEEKRTCCKRNRNYRNFEKGV